MGLLGGGGTILLIPVLVYIKGMPAGQATSYSLACVCLAAFWGVIRSLQTEKISSKVLVYFGLPLFISVYLTRGFVFSAIPSFFHIGSYTTISKDALILLVFVSVMLWVSFLMIQEKKPTAKKRGKVNPFMLMSSGVFIGLLTGIIGIGGGFLIVPVLVLFMGLSMQSAIVHSLVLIFISAGVGCVSDFISGVRLDVVFLLCFALMASVGLSIGRKLSVRVNQQTLKKGFGYFILLMAALILCKELMKN